ncbi:MAG: molybdopterin-dependent oxidoreductase [Butyricicoccus pullicaecorum]|nr:molybdopterin-dependent oxidoreductase [Butyricicoccus pullicaecorum]MDO4668275.1 molybdopterin-dependent oxidoreductase [Butyricicoccus pullicaecorum]
MKQKYVGTGVRKSDAKALTTGQPVYTDDIAPANCLIVKILRSPHAHALIQEINTEIAKKVPGIVCVLTFKDVPHHRFTMAGQTFPEPSPYDRLILEQRVRFVGDAVAIVAGETEEAVDRALRLVKVKYEVLEPVLDFHHAIDHHVLVHPEEDWVANCPVGADNHRNLCASGQDCHGDIEAVLADCDVVLERTYHTKANQQTPMETFRTFTQLDTYGRLNIISSTQVPFHVRRILSTALGIPKSKIRVVKPRLGGGFGAKQTVVTEVYPAIVTMKTGRPAKIVYTREESMIASSPRHEMEVTVRIGAMRDGRIRGIDLYTLSNTGAFGEHGPTTVGLSGHKSIPLYSGNQEAFRFRYDVVYTNVMSSGAYRGYGATQGTFAVESIVNELADLLGRDPIDLRMQNMVREGQVMPAYYGETAAACALDRCVQRVREMIDWDHKIKPRVMPNGHVRAVGMAMAMQGSAISNVDIGAVIIRLSDDGTYNMLIGCTDMGTGCDTILAQMAADCLECRMEDIAVYASDTDTAPYDSGSYASATTYVTGMACVRACEELRGKIIRAGAKILMIDEEMAAFDGERVYDLRDDSRAVSLSDIAYSGQCNCSEALSATVSHSSPVSPPPFMAGACEVEVDLETGKVELLDYVAAVDCGTPINPNLARVQTEGGLVQGIGMALYEDIVYAADGTNLSNSFLQYKIPSRLDIGTIRVEFESSYEQTGPFGAKSIGEIVINTPSPAIADAVARATGVRVRTLPITAEKIVCGRMEAEAAQ